MSGKPWAELVAPTIHRCEVAAKFGMNATWNADGAAALGELLRTMAETLDEVNAKICPAGRRAVEQSEGK